MATDWQRHPQPRGDVLAVLGECGVRYQWPPSGLGSTKQGGGVTTRKGEGGRQGRPGPALPLIGLALRDHKDGGQCKARSSSPMLQRQGFWAGPLLHMHLKAWLVPGEEHGTGPAEAAAPAWPAENNLCFQRVCEKQ